VGGSNHVGIGEVVNGDDFAKEIAKIAGIAKIW
jgi:hypothetical protein